MAVNRHWVRSYVQAHANEIGAVTSVAGRAGAVTLTKSDVGLGNVDNVSDANKPVSTAQAAADALKLAKASNLSDVASASSARTNLGLGGAATLNVGTSAGTVAAGDDSRITGAAQKASNLSDLASASSARTNLGLGGAATLSVGTSAGTVAAGDDSRITGAAQKSSNLSDLASASTAVANLGLGLNWGPADFGYLTWAYDAPDGAAGAASALATAGTIYTIRMHNPIARNITNIIIFLSSAGSSLTSGQCFAALYRTDTWALLGTTADQASAWATNGMKTMAISGGAVAAPAVDLVVGLWFNGTTGPSPFRTNGVSLVNGALSAANSKYGTADTGRTTSAPSTLATIAAANVAYWAALS